MNENGRVFRNLTPQAKTCLSALGKTMSGILKACQRYAAESLKQSLSSGPTDAMSQVQRAVEAIDCSVGALGIGASMAVFAELTEEELLEFHRKERELVKRIRELSLEARQEYLECRPESVTDPVLKELIETKEALLVSLVNKIADHLAQQWQKEKAGAAPQGTDESSVPNNDASAPPLSAVWPENISLN